MTDPKLAMQSAIEIQRDYYAQTADRYDGMHGADNIEHTFALHFMLSACKYLGVKSILDIGSGTGRTLFGVKAAMPEVTVVGVEPSPELRNIGYSKGLDEAELVDGDAMKLSFREESFDLVCEFGALHHIPVPSEAVAEMLRVSRKAIFISDCNNFGRGNSLERFIKQSINAAGLWPLFYKLRTNGKGYAISEEDGLAYSYSVFNDLKQIQSACASIHMLNPQSAGPNLYRTASHVALLGLKHPISQLIGGESASHMA